jgi:hypothetical protein
MRLPTTTYAESGAPAGLRRSWTVAPTPAGLMSMVGSTTLVISSPWTPESLFGSSTGAPGAEATVRIVMATGALTALNVPAWLTCSAV